MVVAGECAPRFVEVHWASLAVAGMAADETARDPQDARVLATEVAFRAAIGHATHTAETLPPTPHLRCRRPDHRDR